MTHLSVVVLAHGSSTDLSGVMLGLDRQTQRPSELVVAVMQHKPFNLPQMHFPVTQMRVAANPQLLAAARNAAAMAATGEVIVFLDQRCVPHPNLIEDYTRAASVFDGVIMGEVMSPPNGLAPADWRYQEVGGPAAKPSPSRSLPVRGLELCEGPQSFSALNFAVRRDTFMSVDGFDERVGVEESEFGDRLTRAGVPMARIKGGIAYYS